MSTPETTPIELNRPRGLARLVHAFIWIAVASLMVWLMLPPPAFAGIRGAVAVVYFLALIGAGVCSFLWLFRFGNGNDADKNVPPSRGCMTAILVISILSTVASASLAFLAIAISGLFGMI